MAKKITISKKDVQKYLGSPTYDYTRKNETDEIGTVMGLSWSQVGGDVIPIEVNIIPSKTPVLINTGSLGEVMKESSQAAFSFVQANAETLGIEPDIFQCHTIHVHATSAGTPKEGPSAGVTIASAMVSALKKTPARADVAMTGEISLRGKVLKIGGLREKILAAHRSGIKEVIIPKDNLPDTEKIPKEVLDEVIVHPVSNIMEVLDIILVKCGE